MQFGAFEVGASEYGAPSTSPTTPSNSFSVVGAVSLAVNHAKGTVSVTGACSCAGAIGLSLSLTSAGSCSVVGEILATFLQRAGQQESCISGPDTPAAGKPSNAVH